MSRTAAVEHAVRQLAGDGTPTSPAEIESFLNSVGRADTRDQIGAALAYLNRKNVVERASRAQWRMWTGEGIDDTQP
jgi:hypothetical protein